MTKNELIKNLAWLREEAGLEPAYPINHPMAKFIMAISERAKAQEREACAKVAEQVGQHKNQHGIASAIRARGQA
jgi:hypothetical protein